MRFAFFASLLLAALPAHRSGAQEVLVIGLTVPLGDDLAVLGQQWADGARAAANGDGSVRLVEADSGCTEEGGAAAARQLMEAGASIVIGFLCTPAIEAALPLLTQAGIPVITPVRTTGLTDHKTRTGWQVYRLGPRADAERRAVSDMLVRRWRGDFFAIVDDGTIYGRELAEDLRAQAELAELEPVFVDTFRPQLDNQIGLVGRLRRAGATHIFVGGDRADIAIMARDAANLGYEVVFAGGEALKAEDGPIPLPEGVLMVGMPDWRELAAPEALAALEEVEVIAEGYVVPGFAALEVASTALREAAAQGVPVQDVLSNHDFQTSIGTVRFDEKGDMTRNLYGLFRYDGRAFVEVE